MHTLEPNGDPLGQEGEALAYQAEGEYFEVHLLLGFVVEVPGYEARGKQEGQGEDR